MHNTELPPYVAFYNKLHGCSLLEAGYTDYVNLVKNGMTAEQAVAILKLSKMPLKWVENYQYLQKTWKQELMSSFRDFLRWYNNKEGVPILEAMQKMITFYHKKNDDLLNLGFTSPNLAITSLLKPTYAKFHPITERDKDLLQTIRDNMLGGPSIVFTRKAVIDKTFIGKLTS